MIIIRQNNYSSFLQRLRGNQELKAEMFKAIGGGGV